MKRTCRIVNFRIGTDILKEAFSFFFGTIALSSLKSYLIIRKQFIFLRSDLTENRACKNGVPQGSILGQFHWFVKNNLDLNKCKSQIIKFNNDAKKFKGNFAKEL